MPALAVIVWRTVDDDGSALARRWRVIIAMSVHDAPRGEHHRGVAGGY